MHILIIFLTATFSYSFYLKLDFMLEMTIKIVVMILFLSKGDN
jgi:hypothetical protein